MYAITFDLLTEDLLKVYPKSRTCAYYEIKQCLRDYGFYNVQGSVYQSPDASLVDLYDAVDALRTIPWFPLSVRDVRAYRVEEWSDFTDRVKGAKRLPRNKKSLIED